MKLILCDLNPELCTAWQKEFAGYSQDEVEIVNGNILEVEADALVSPANSFGYMTGGIDGAYTKAFGVQLQDRVQAAITGHWNGELPIGCAVAVEIGVPSHFKHLVAAPTMRYPMNVSSTINAYLAMKASLHKAWWIAGSVAVPGLATLTGRMPPDVAARQMAQAYRDFLKPTFPSQRFESIVQAEAWMRSGE